MIWGISALCHDAAISVIDGDRILFAAHAERYSKKKNDAYLNKEIVDEAMSFGVPDAIAFYENRWLKKQRQLCDFRFGDVMDFSKFPRKYLSNFGLGKIDIYVFNHHESHAAAGYYTSDFDEAAIVVIDAIGEWQTITIWKAVGEKMTLVEEVNYPSSIGLLYSAFTKRCGFKPNEEEYILMGMAAYGSPIHKEKMYDDFVDEKCLFGLKKRCEKGVADYMPEAKVEDLASSIQDITEECVMRIIKRAKELTGSDNLVYSGGVALNCVINSKLPSVFKNTWIVPNPGDAGSSLGCCALIGRKKIQWDGCFLGHNISGDYPVDDLLEELSKGRIVGVANGPAEFGPRALGNRSLLADPRNPNTKDDVNKIKNRQKFRPFAPAILEEDASEFFDMPVAKSPYMQYVACCKQPNRFPSICHVDGTSRVQTVTEKDNSGFYNLIKLFKEKTGCPMLLNTSLNIKGMPIVNDIKDAKKFENLYQVRVCS